MAFNGIPIYITILKDGTSFVTNLGFNGMESHLHANQCMLIYKEDKLDTGNFLMCVSFFNNTRMLLI